MAMKEQQRSVYRSMQGKEIDMEKLRNQNELTVAVGNVKVNARGDELGPGGKIIKKREDVLRAAAGAVPSQSVKRQTKNVADMDPEGNE
jgi:hypothetical protein